VSDALSYPGLGKVLVKQLSLSILNSPVDDYVFRYSLSDIKKSKDRCQFETNFKQHRFQEPTSAAEEFS